MFLLRLLKKLFFNFVWWLKRQVILLGIKKHPDHCVSVPFSIGIVTYVDRFERHFMPLIKSLAKVFPDTEIIIAVNGYHDLELQQKYLSRLENFLSRFSNIRHITFLQPQSLSKLWNLLIINSSFERTLILNDDIQISSTLNFDLFQSEIFIRPFALLNRSWSHFMISKEVVNEIGWFDERFPGVGNEDEDYECRMVLNGMEVFSVEINSIRNIVFETKNFSYGASVELINTKYIKANKIFFDSKWLVTNEQKDGFHYVAILGKYVKLKKGMSTPDFYAIKY